MATQFDAIAPAHQKFIEAQHLFFCATAAQDGRVNLSPKGMDSLRVMGPNRIVWRNLTGSGNETAAHLAKVNRITLMWCGFEAQPMIMRAYGSARTLHADHAEFAALDAMFPPSPGARQIYDVAVDMLQTSCGYAVPMFEHVKERPILRDWAEAKGPDGIATYWTERNQTSIDGMPTGTPTRDA
ncbi:pyridoxamine 5'-phosphate oxidase family protein [Sulfitobacter albidus]|uniref:Pyridoxamine 5'-phosphate oxidase family protein n=1 Tax=Sulfitobacter albidus TaxID=2829501 RepID=A0A975JAU8_9RHOB|nr:pyridoxamine 5'-phosphate oxidase family protein [Sulfitobacter albidus]QUJ75069.1 pyridoxamine 5'-phosphate oxidase family protein [Sulfitobacter albidus]